MIDTAHEELPPAIFDFATALVRRGKVVRRLHDHPVLLSRDGAPGVTTAPIIVTRAADTGQPVPYAPSPEDMLSDDWIQMIGEPEQVPDSSPAWAEATLNHFKEDLASWRGDHEGWCAAVILNPYLYAQLFSRIPEQDFRSQTERGLLKLGIMGLYDRIPLIMSRLIPAPGWRFL